MKIRKGFVSNSSASSFICELCGAEEIGWDCTLDDAGMCECECGHLICKSHLVNLDDFDDGPILSKHCPLCQLDHVSDTDILNYVLKKHYQSREVILAEIQDKYENYAHFLKEMKDEEG